MSLYRQITSVVGCHSDGIHAQCWCMLLKGHDGVVAILNRRPSCDGRNVVNQLSRKKVQ